MSFQKAGYPKSKHKAQRNHGIKARIKGRERSPMYQPFYRYLKEADKKVAK